MGWWLFVVMVVEILMCTIFSSSQDLVDRMCGDPSTSEWFDPTLRDTFDARNRASRIHGVYLHPYCVRYCMLGLYG
ncbi:hypothetical protein QJS10_CPB21g01407 [Acorus calamus]|uniref:Secreted protein n=1 Tax=Acorus calamus TaxID=4465 RepID=A0AAV9C5J0_ACOCL|nr:hypothetical protein QJS10_CPB21g01407 [Acorus calamus]